MKKTALATAMSIALLGASLNANAFDIVLDQGNITDDIVLATDGVTYEVSDTLTTFLNEKKTNLTSAQQAYDDALVNGTEITAANKFLENQKKYQQEVQDEKQAVIDAAQTELDKIKQTNADALQAAQTDVNATKFEQALLKPELDAAQKAANEAIARRDEIIAQNQVSVDQSIEKINLARADFDAANETAKQAEQAFLAVGKSDPNYATLQKELQDATEAAETKQEVLTQQAKILSNIRDFNERVIEPYEAEVTAAETALQPLAEKNTQLQEEFVENEKILANLPAFLEPQEKAAEETVATAVAELEKVQIQATEDLKAAEQNVVDVQTMLQTTSAEKKAFDQAQEEVIEAEERLTTAIADATRVNRCSEYAICRRYCR